MVLVGDLNNKTDLAGAKRVRPTGGSYFARQNLLPNLSLNFPAERTRANCRVGRPRSSAGSSN
jgi:hypothetical protein